MLSFALMVQKKLEPIIRYRKQPISNGRAEGTDSLIMAVQRSARGYRSHASLRIAALFHCGRLGLYPKALSTEIK